MLLLRVEGCKLAVAVLEVYVHLEMHLRVMVGSSVL